MIINDFDVKYTLGENWILRADPYCHFKEYSIYNIESRLTLYITKACYTILTIFSRKALSFNVFTKVLKEKNIEFDWSGFNDVCKSISPFDLLVKSEVALRKADYWDGKNGVVGYDLPVASAPFGIEMHFTHKCNLKCAHCFQGSSPRSERFEELEENEWLEIFEQFETNKIREVTISGGEPLYYSHFTSLFNKIVNRRLNYTILTNGTLVNSDNVQALSKKNVFLSISLDGYSEEMHDQLRGKGAYKKVMEAINLLIAHKAQISLAYTLNSYNYKYLREIIELACSLGVQGLTFGFTDKMGRANDNLDLVLSTSQRKIIKHDFYQLKEEYYRYIHLDLIEVASMKNPFYVSDKIYCSAGTIRAGVSADGKLYPCVYAFGYKELIMGDLTKEKLKDIWEKTDKWNMFRGGLRLEQIDTCSSCALNKKCALKNCRLRNYGIGNSLYNKPLECAVDYSITL